MVCEFRKFHSAVFVLFRTSGRLFCISGLATFCSNVTPRVHEPENLKLKTTSTFETSENTQPNTQCHNPEDRNPTNYGLFNDAESTFLIHCRGWG